MNNNTPEDDYKELIRSKFEEEKEGGYSNYLSNPTQANLRDLCWKILKLNPKPDDLNVYFDFFKSKFDSIEEDTSVTYTDKFRKVGDFLRRKKEPAKIDTVNLAAILVDFEPRPYKKFRKAGVKESFEESYDSKNSDIFELIEKDNTPKKEEPLNFLQPENSIKILEEEEEEDLIQPKRINLFINFKKEFVRKETIIVISAVSCLLFAVFYFALLKKQCMQWSEDHYEKVDCNSNTNGFAVTNIIEPFDEVKCELKKIKVCDTTKFFNQNQEAIVWYAKTKDGADFFNTHGRHPESGKPLRPVTEYIVKKYGK